MTDHNDEPASSDDLGFKIAVAFVAVALVGAVLFAIYALAWNGGAHT